MANTPPNTQDELDAQALMEQLIQDFMAVASPEDMHEFWRGVPSELEAAFVQLIEMLIAQAQQEGQTQIVDNLAARLRDFKQIQAQAAQAQNLPPVIKALRAFIAADDETAARAVFAAQNALLQPYEAQHLLDSQQVDDPALQQRLQARSALLRELRGATPPPTPTPPPATAPHRPPARADEEQPLTFHNQGLNLGGNLYQAETITIHTVRQMARLWRKPSAPDPGAMVPRHTDMQRVLDKLRHTGNVALTGKAQRVGVYGMPGVGKTTLAKLLAHTAQADYPDGVLWLDVGPHLRKREDGQALLNQAMCDYFVADGEHKNFTPEAARALWAEHPNMLVVFDNVWSLEGIKLLREALPSQTHQLLTTRRRDLLHNSGLSAETLDVLSETDALALVALRLASAPAKQRAQVDWLIELIQPLGYHPLALDIALRLMQPDDTLSQWRNIIQALVKAVREGNAFNQLQLDEDIDSQANVAAALQVSYDYLPNANTRQRFCQLGVFALESAFGATQAAAVWQCEQAEAENTLRLFSLHGLLQYSDIQLQIFAANPSDTPTPPERVWQQHSLVRGYALALLRQSLGFEASAYRHANAYNEAMRQANNAQAYHTLWYAYGQLVQAFEWSIVNNLTLAQRLIGNCANLQSQSNRLGHNLDWSQRALQAAQQRGTEAELGMAYGSLGNALQHSATIMGDDRGRYLLAALHAYDDALRFLRPDTAPLDYATTQNNRATLLSAIANLPGEDRRARLLAALHAYDDALRFRRPDTAPLDYAQTQNNRATLLSEIANLPGEDRRARLLAALTCAWQAIGLFEQLEHTQYLQVAENTLRRVWQACGDEAESLWQAAGLGALPDLTPSPPNLAEADWQALLQRFAAIQDENALIEFWQAVPSALKAPFIQIVAGLIEQAQSAGDEAIVSALQARLEGFKAISAQAATASSLDQQQHQPPMADLQATVETFQSLIDQANNDENNLTLWQQATQAGEAMLEKLQPFAERVQLNEFETAVAQTYNSLGNAQNETDKPSSLQSYERAMALHPQEAMYRRNYAGTLIELGQLALAEQAIAQAQQLEPSAPRLAQLWADLAQARAARSA